MIEIKLNRPINILNVIDFTFNKANKQQKTVIYKIRFGKQNPSKTKLPLEVKNIINYTLTFCLSKSKDVFNFIYHI